MKKKKNIIKVFTFFTILMFSEKSIAQATKCPTSAVDYTEKSCQCVQYVKRRLGYNDGTIHADTWGSALICKGFLSQSTPTNKDIMLINRTYGHGINATSGHVALVVSATESADKKSFVITFINTNWGSGTSSKECGCTNVTTNAMTILKTAIGSTVFFYRNASMIQKCAN
jgi:hypothetical protein